MRGTTQVRIAILVAIALVMITGRSYGEDAVGSGQDLTGGARFRYDWFGVNEDRGRFREDNWMTDGSTGGLDWLHAESLEPDRNGYEWVVEGRALYDYNYDFSFLMKKQDSHYLKLDFTSFRRYYDGSNEYWDETLYGLPASSGGYGPIGGTSEHSDFDFFVDRRNYNVEFGLTPPEGSQWTFGWHRLEKDGIEVLARGARARAAGLPDFRGIPAIADTQGTTDTLYGEVARTFAEKYNFRLRQEFEQYRDDQYIAYPRYASGALQQYRTLQDDPGYTNWRTILMFDSFLDEQTYTTANYMYNYLNNNSGREMIRPDQVNPNSFINTDVGNSRRTNVGSFGFRRANFVKDKLNLSLGLRLEDSRTSSQSSGWSGGTTLREAMSNYDDVRVGETLRLVYKGIKKTSLSFDADVEQRYVDWSEREDIGSYEIFGEGAGVGGILERTADIDYRDQIYTLKAVHRHNRALKSTFKFRIKDLQRSYTELFDNDTSAYPGYLGNYRRRGNDITAKTDWRMNSTTTSTLMYQFVREGIGTSLGGKTSNWEIHRGSGSLSVNPSTNLFVVGTFMLENYDLDTPANGSASSNVATGPRPYDFRGNSYSLLLDGTYAFNERTSCTLGFQHTEALGTVDYAGDYVFDRVGVTLKRKMAKNRTVGLGYQFYNFNNHDGGSFDDYKAHGAFVTYGFTF